MKRILYYVHGDRMRKWSTNFPGFSNFKVFKNQQAALRFFHRNPKCGQIDIRGWDRKGNRVSFCWKYWDRGKIITQKSELEKPQPNN